MSEVLRLEAITRRYKEGEGQLEVFSGLDLSLRAGEIVLTGSLVKTIWLKAGDRVEMQLDGLGNVQATFS